ncbi:MAG: HD domain-containing protein [Atribacterota bacterium]|nr:HD domain-containing protein [Atribacterota bacterium]
MFEKYWEFLKKVFAEDPKMIPHTEEVFRFARIIAQDLGIAGKEQKVIELSALLHDVGIVEAFRKYGSREGKYQHIEGPPLARFIMEQEGEPEDVIERVTFIVGHHHDFSCVDGLDFQILIEADMLVNLADEKWDKEKLVQFIKEFFHTSKGWELGKEKYLLDR